MTKLAIHVGGLDPDLNLVLRVDAEVIDSHLYRIDVKDLREFIKDSNFALKKYGGMIVEKDVPRETTN
jgi:hypothetical protein